MHSRHADARGQVSVPDPVGATAAVRAPARPGAGTGRRPILMFGTSLQSTGGVAAVLQLYRKEGLFEHENVVYIPTHVDGTARQKITVFAHGIVRLIRSLADRPRLAHIHLASHASFWRKLIVGVI